jgi:hypothetical protein
VIAAWFDPGLLTGVCVYDFLKDELVLLDEFDYIRTGEVLEPGSTMFAEPQPLINVLDVHRVHVGWESYRIMKGPQSQAPWSLEVIGELRYLSAKHGYTVLDPAEPNARTVTTGNMLKDIGWYPKVKAKKDAYSAAQHMIAFMLRENILPDKFKDAIYGPLR